MSEKTRKLRRQYAAEKKRHVLMKTIEGVALLFVIISLVKYTY